jgi:hypothetical protein
MFSFERKLIFSFARFIFHVLRRLIVRRETSRTRRDSFDFRLGNEKRNAVNQKRENSDCQQNAPEKAFRQRFGFGQYFSHFDLLISTYSFLIQLFKENRGAAFLSKLRLVRLRKERQRHSLPPLKPFPFLVLKRCFILLLFIFWR